MYRKVTVGFVVQEFNENGDCTRQEFIASDDCTWENENGDQVPPSDILGFPADQAYFGFDMRQPDVQSDS